jgi:hypothetical protein
MGILSACDATVNLNVLDPIHDAAPAFLPILNALPLQRLYARSELLFQSATALENPLFAHITHLHLVHRHTENLSELKLLPRLTHLSLPADSRVPDLVHQRTLERCKSLQVMALVCQSQKQLYQDAPLRAPLGADLRFVMFVVESTWIDGEIGAFGGRDRWAKADEYVRKRRSGENTGEWCRIWPDCTKLILVLMRLFPL